MSFSFYWHDYETWGADPRRDRAAQFAGQRTDADLNPIGEPLVIHAKPADDMLPRPEACLVTGITPQYALEHGMPEAEFFRQIHSELIRPGTCTSGYNSIRFDDEFTRFGFYRNFIDVYAREWQGGNSRWDIIDVLRLAHALRPEGIEWPENEDGTASFRLDRLSVANGLAHADAHDALGDVRVTIEMARLLKARHPRLYDYCFTHRGKQAAGELLNLRERREVLHVSSMYPAVLGCIAPVIPIGMQPGNRNGVIVFDLRTDPHILMDLDAEELHYRLFTPSAELADGIARVQMKTVHLNKCPVLAPMNTLTSGAADRWMIDIGQVRQHAQTLLGFGDLQAKLDAVHAIDARREFSEDPDQTLYGGFFSDRDREEIAHIRKQTPEELADCHPAFDDAKLHELLFRYRARNWLETLNTEERQRWEAYRRWRLTDPAGGASIVSADYFAEIDRLLAGLGKDDKRRGILGDLRDWGERLTGC